MHLRVGILVSTILIAGAVFAQLNLVNASSSQITNAAPEAVLNAAKAIAVNNSDGHPSLAQYVLTARQAAVTASDGGVVDSNGSVYYIVMRGHFVDHHGRTAAGAADPAGNQLEVTVDAQTGDVLDMAILHRPTPPSLDKFGLVHDITQDVQQP